jgi:two-component system, NtrC family, response regulator AtoC
MPQVRSPDQTLRTLDTHKMPGDELAPDLRYSLLIFVGESVSSVALPVSGDAVIGRSREADVHVPHDSLSRKHAALKIEGGAVKVRDLGSQNGTKVNQRSVKDEWVTLELGDALKLGNATAVLQKSPAARAHRRLWTHGYFEARLEEECARGVGVFLVVRLHVTPAEKEASAAEVISRALGAGDCLASYAPGELEALMLGVPKAQALEQADRLVAALEPLGVRARTGVACFPNDGRGAERLLAIACAEAASEEGAQEPAKEPQFVVASPGMKRLYEMIDRVAQTDVSVLVQGETGVGKEVVSRAIHDRSERAKKPYVALSCAALPENLLESELFGHEKGAFTGATEARNGLLESAQGGTVFLDELGEMALSTQAKLLRVIEEKAVRRVGGAKSRSIDVRFVAATNRDLEAEVKAGRFRQDLFFRVTGVMLWVPPLRERREELEPLAQAFLKRSGSRLKLSSAALQRLHAYAWPGNVRELRNAIERAQLLATGPSIQPEHLPLEKMTARWLDATPAPVSEVPPVPEGGDEAERDRIIEALNSCAGNQTRAARRLGISRRTLLYRLDAYGLPRPQKRPKE